MSKYNKDSINYNKKGAPFKFEPEELSDKIEEYFSHIDNNPIQKIKTETSNKDTKEIIEYIKRPYTIEGLCNYLGIQRKTFMDWESQPLLINIVTYARQKIYENKLEGAIAGVFNANIIIRDLSLRDESLEVVNNILIPLSRKELASITQTLDVEYGEVPDIEPLQIEAKKSDNE